MKEKPAIKILGLMSGTSLDGLDLALCSFNEDQGSWQYHIYTAETVPYDREWLDRLSTAGKLDGFHLTRLDLEYGQYLGRQSAIFLEKTGLKADYIASHGHTVFHKPESGLTLQIGNGAALAASAGIPVICDFRTQDVRMGGQGAPLVPIGDELLFGYYDYCLNLGGFSNISYRANGCRVASDVSPCNLVLNALAQRSGYLYDPEGSIAASGKINDDLLEKLNTLAFYTKTGPKSLGREWVEDKIFTLLHDFPISTPDLLRTFVEHISVKIAETTLSAGKGSVLVTGGGAKNHFLIAGIQEKTASRLIIPETLTIDFKEALIFAFLGLLRLEGKNNILSSVSGSHADHCGGCIYLA
jgi:anhydro-N-acetylmuramic acid kinase